MNLKKQWIYIVLAVVVFAILLGLATAFDYQISSTIADLEKGEFFSNNVFGKFIEVIGSFPIYYMIALALFAIGYNYQRLGKRAWQLVLFFVFYLFLSLFCFCKQRINFLFDNNNLLTTKNIYVKLN